MRRIYSKPAADVFRSALVDAISDREAMLASLANAKATQDVEYRQEVQAAIEDYKLMLKRCFNPPRATATATRNNADGADGKERLRNVRLP